MASQLCWGAQNLMYFTESGSCKWFIFGKTWNDTCRIKRLWWNITILSSDLVTFTRGIARQIYLFHAPSVFTVSVYVKHCIFGNFLKKTCSIFLGFWELTNCLSAFYVSFVWWAQGIFPRCSSENGMAKARLHISTLVENKDILTHSILNIWSVAAHQSLAACLQ